MSVLTSVGMSSDVGPSVPAGRGLVPSPTSPFVVGHASDLDGHAERPVLSLIIPTYNEANNIGPLLVQLQQLLSSVLDTAFEIIVVDDNSPDETWRRALDVAAELPTVRVVRRIDERGLSTAVIRGWQVARGEILGVIDADLQHPPEVCLALLGEITRGADLAVASRNVAGGGVSEWSLVRRILSRGAQMLGLLILPEVFGRLSDPMSGFFLIRRAAIEGVALDPLGYKILIEVATRGRAHWVAEAPYVFRERNEGDSKVTWKLYLEYLRHLARLRLATTSGSPFLRYALVGGVGFVIETCLLYWLSEPQHLGLGIARSKLLAAQPTLLFNFILHELWTFSRVVRPKELNQVLRRLLAYYVVASVGLGFVLLILSSLVHFFQLDQYSANAVAIMIVAGWNYWLHRKVTWAEAALPLDVSVDVPHLRDELSGRRQAATGAHETRSTALPSRNPPHNVD